MDVRGYGCTIHGNVELLATCHHRVSIASIAPGSIELLESINMCILEHSSTEGVS